MKKKTKTKQHSAISVVPESRLIAVGGGENLESLPPENVAIAPLVVSSRGLSYVEFAEAVADNTALTEEESAELTKQEAIVEKGIKTSLAVAIALYTINIRKLYRANFPSFEKYLSTRWQIGRAYGYEQVTAGRAIEALSGSADTPVADSVNQLSKLGSLKEPQLIQEANREARELLKSGRSPAAAVTEAVEKRQKPRRSEAQKVKRSERPVASNEPKRQYQRDSYVGSLESLYKRIQEILGLIEEGTTMEVVREKIEEVKGDLQALLGSDHCEAEASPLPHTTA